MEVTHITSRKKHGEGRCEVSMLSFLFPSNQEGHDFFFFPVSLDP